MEMQRTEQVTAPEAAAESSRILAAVMDLGETMLAAGGEAGRVEDTISRVGLAYGFRKVDVFTITSCIFATIEDEAGLYYLDRSRDVLAGRDRAALMALPNVVVTPHMAFYTAEDVEGMVRSNVEALLAFAAGESTPYEV